MASDQFAGHAVSTRVHGIRDCDVQNKPSFELVAPTLAQFLENADLAGFNLVHFDLPILSREFRRAGVAFRITGRAILDAYRIYIRKEARDLASAVRRYTGNEHRLAHAAEADAWATAQVLNGQLEAYPELPREPAALHRRLTTVDVGGRFRRGLSQEIILGFGKYQGLPLEEVARTDPDYLKQGRKFYPGGGAACPFCQQPTDAALADKLNEYFDETFVKDTEAIATLATQYSQDAERLWKSLDALLATDCAFLDKGALKLLRDTLAAQLGANVQRLEAKQKEPSQIVEFESVAAPLASAVSFVEAANTQIAEHNAAVANITQERANLTAQVWKYLIAVELKDALADYDAKKGAIDKAQKSIDEQSKCVQKAYSDKIAELRQLEKGITTIQPTIDTINGLLLSFGFRGFSLAKAGEEENYKIVRADGSDAKESLSEGEKTFITFLYFYHLLKGSNSESGTVTDRVVVIDDPVSSLDSDIWFIVSSLIKILFQEVRDKKTGVKQVFVLTHNVYFHKEVTFSAKRRGGGKMREETFWTVRKSDESTRVVCHQENPITSHYDLLWADVRRG